MGNSGKFVSYGSCNKIIHFFDYGFTGQQLGPQGHNEFSICGDEQLKNCKIVMQCIPLELVDHTIKCYEDEGDILTPDDEGYEYCKKCCIKLRRHIKEFGPFE